jgi:hypothetical protein
MYYIKYLDMFQAILCSSAEGQNCISTASGIISRPYSAPVQSGLSPLSTSALYGRSQGVTIPDSVKIQFGPPEDEYSIARNMSRYLM